MSMIYNTSSIPNERRQVATFLLTVLQAVLNEQEKARLIDHDTARYIYAACKDQAQKMGWVD